MAPINVEDKSRPIMSPLHTIEFARLRMLETRKALEDYEKMKGLGTSSEYIKLTHAFNKATEVYFMLSERQRRRQT